MRIEWVKQRGGKNVKPLHLETRRRGFGGGGGRLVTSCSIRKTNDKGHKEFYPGLYTTGSYVTVTLWCRKKIRMIKTCILKRKQKQNKTLQRLLRRESGCWVSVCVRVCECVWFPSRLLVVIRRGPVLKKKKRHGTTAAAEVSVEKIPAVVRFLYVRLLRWSCWPGWGGHQWRR